MQPIYRYPTVRRLCPNDLLIVCDVSNSDTRKVAVGALVDLAVRESLDASTGPDAPETVVGDGFNLSLRLDRGKNLWVRLNPPGTIAGGTLTLPHDQNLSGGCEILVTSTQQITRLSILTFGGGKTAGLPRTLRADGFFKLKYSLINNEWRRVV